MYGKIFKQRPKGRSPGLYMAFLALKIHSSSMMKRNSCSFQISTKLDQWCQSYEENKKLHVFNLIFTVDLTLCNITRKSQQSYPFMVVTSLWGSSDHPGSVQSRYKVDSGNPWEKNFHPWKKISTRGKKFPRVEKKFPRVEKNFHAWKSQMYRLIDYGLLNYVGDISERPNLAYSNNRYFSRM